MEKPLTGMKKRQKIDSARRTLFIWVVVASVVVVVCAVLAQFLLRQMMFNFKIIGAKMETSSTLQKNIDTIDELKRNVNKTLVGSDILTSLRADSSDTAPQVVIDALPTEDDRAALGASLQEKVLAGTGVRIDSLAVVDSFSSPVADAMGTEASTTPEPIEFTMTLAGNYDQLKTAVENMQRSIRPFDINSLKLEGSGNELRANMSVTTYYLPAKVLMLQKETIEP